MGVFAVNHLMVHAHSRFVDAHNVYELTQAIQDWAPDVAYLGNLVGIGGLGIVGALQHLRLPWVWQLGDCVPVLICAGRRGPYPRLAEEFSRTAEGSYICVSETVRREVEQQGIRLNGRVELLPYWITGARSQPRENYFTGGHLRIMSAGSVNRDKGIGILIEAADRLRSLGIKNFSVDIYGKIGDQSLPHLIRHLDLDEIVRLKGPRPHTELLERYSEYDIFAFPTLKREPFGIVPIEAAARGCVPLITSRCGVAEWLVHGVHCLKAERSSEAFAETLHAVATGTIPLGPIARRATELAWREFHLDVILPKIEAVLVVSSRTGSCSVDPKTAADLYRLARMAEQLTEGLVEESIGA